MYTPVFKNVVLHVFENSKKKLVNSEIGIN